MALTATEIAALVTAITGGITTIAGAVATVSGNSAAKRNDTLVKDTMKLVTGHNERTTEAVLAKFDGLTDLMKDLIKKLP